MRSSLGNFQWKGGYLQSYWGWHIDMREATKSDPTDSTIVTVLLRLNATDAPLIGCYGRHVRGRALNLPILRRRAAMKKAPPSINDKKDNHDT